MNVCVKGVCVETRIVELLEYQIDFANTEVKPDVLFLKLKGGGFYLCCKEFGIQPTKSIGIIQVKRIFGRGKSERVSGGEYGTKK